MVRRRLEIANRIVRKVGFGITPKFWWIPARPPSNFGPTLALRNKLSRDACAGAKSASNWCGVPAAA